MKTESSSEPSGQNPDALKDAGLAQFKQGERDEALSTFEKAAAAYSRVGNTAGEAEMQNNIGVIYRMKRDWAGAISALKQAEAGFAAIDDDMRQAQVLGNIGDLYAATHDYHEAAKYYSDSSELFASIGRVRMQADVLRAFSLMRLRQRRWNESIDLMALSIEVRPDASIAHRILYLLLQSARKLLRSA
jgi:tetratricopeptide (TPR) repeat protein